MNKTTLDLVILGALVAGLGSAHATEDASCKFVFDATAKSLTAPNHSYMKMTNPLVNGGKPTEHEFINTGKARYRKQDDGTWVAATSPQAEIEQMADNRKDEDNQYTCRFVRDESVDGIAASLYEIHLDGGLMTSTWLSKANGFPLRSITYIGGTSDERFVYGPVTAPPLK